MHYGPELQTLALREFDLEFGELLSSVEFDGDFYLHFQKDFLAGVQMGLEHPDWDRDAIEFEGELRRMYSPFSEGDTNAEASAARVSSFAFMYGITWAHVMLSAE